MVYHTYMPNLVYVNIIDIYTYLTYYIYIYNYSHKALTILLPRCILFVGNFIQLVIYIYIYN